MSELTKLVEQDILDWIENYVEVPQAFYDYKFAPCPYAKAARLKGYADVVAYESGNIKDFIEHHINILATEKKHGLKGLIFPPRTKYYFGMKKMIAKINEQIIPEDLYCQYGLAIQTNSRYSGWLNSGPYFIVLANKLSNVLEGHQSLLSTDYYSHWSKEHYDAVVVRRQNLYEKFGKPQNEEKNDSNL